MPRTKSSARVLSIRELNRALLARQGLLERQAIPVTAMIGRLVGLQSQAQAAPFVGLWTRLTDFTRADLTQVIADRSVVKATFNRATLHILTADDYLSLRGAIQPVFSDASDMIARQRGVELDHEALLRTARAYFAEQPRSFAELSAHFEQLMPGIDISAIRYTIRTHLPLVVMPAGGEWVYTGNPKFTLADEWLGRSLPAPSPTDDFRGLLFRYLAAFGPAGVTDMQAWSGLTKLKDPIEALRPELIVYQDENGRELYDLPDLSLPEADRPAPIRFLPEYDNILLSHSNRTRILADVHRPKVYLPALRVASTFLIDGFVAGVWQVEIAKKQAVATLTLTPFAPISAEQQVALISEADTLMRFIAPGTGRYDVRISEL